MGSWPNHIPAWRVHHSELRKKHGDAWWKCPAWNENSWGMAYWATWTETRPRISDGPLITGSLLSPMLRMEVGDRWLQHQDMKGRSHKHNAFIISPPLPTWKFETIEHPSRRSRGKKHFKEFASLYYGSCLDWRCVSKLGTSKIHQKIVDSIGKPRDFRTSQFWEPTVNKVWYPKDWGTGIDWCKKKSGSMWLPTWPLNITFVALVRLITISGYLLAIIADRLKAVLFELSLGTEDWGIRRRKSSLASLNAELWKACCSFGSRIPNKLHGVRFGDGRNQMWGFGKDSRWHIHITYSLEELKSNGIEFCGLDMKTEMLC